MYFNFLGVTDTKTREWEIDKQQKLKRTSKTHTNTL
jgi:hypothetical protein